MTEQTVDVHVLPTDAPDDTSALESLFNDGTIEPENVFCILGKTEGNGCVNDFSRGLATRAYRDVLAERLNAEPSQVKDKVMLIMSGGTEGILTPHVTVFSRKRTKQASTKNKRLTAGISSTDEIPPEDLGRMGQVERTVEATKQAMDDAGIRDPNDVAFVQIKCPLLTANRIESALDRGETVAVEDTYKSMAYSRASSALGVGIATGEIKKEQVTDESIYSDHSLYSSVASTSAGVELNHSEILVLGNSKESSSSYSIGNSVMQDALDTDAIENAISSASTSDDDIVKNVFAKAQASRNGKIRGRRHVIHNDSDIESTRHARAVTNSVIGAVTGDPLSYVSGGAEHQGPDGGGPVAAILDVD